MNDNAPSVPEQSPPPQASPAVSGQPQPQAGTEQKSGNGLVLGARRKGDVNRLAIVGLLALVTLAIFPIIKIFFVPVVVAATFTTLFFPLYVRILGVFKGKRGFSSFITCFIILICLVAPTYLVVHLVVQQAIDLYQSAEPVVKDIVTQGGNSVFVKKLHGLPIVHWLQISAINFTVPLNEGIKTIATVGTKAINRTSTGLLEFVVNLFVLFFTMFYFFMDGQALIKKVKYLSPIRDDYEDLIMSRFLLISRATVLGTVIIGLVQGTLGALTLLVFGVKHWLLWGFIMIILSIMPVVGAWVVLIPAGIIQIVTGHVWQGIGILLMSFVVISNIDNLIRPRLVGQGAKLHDLVIFFSSLGGIAVFGVMGFIVGPVVAALFVAVLDIYSKEFESQLKEMH